MSRYLITLAAFVTFSQAALAQLPLPPFAQPKVSVAPPEFAVVDTILPEQGNIILRQEKSMTVYEQKFVTETVVVNGQPMTFTKTVMVPVPKVISIKKAWSAAKDKAYDHTGNLLTKEALVERLKAGDTVLLLENGQTLHPAFQKLLSKEAVVLVTSGSP